MSTRSLPTGAVFRRQLLVLQSGVGFGAASVVVGYLVALLRLTPPQWHTFGWLLAGYAAVFALLSERITHGIRAPIVRWLDLRAGSAAPPEATRAAFRAVMDFPRRAFLLGLTGYVAGGVFLAAGMKLCFRDLGPGPVLVILAATATGGFAMNALFFLGVKRRLAALRGELARALPDPRERGALAPRVPIGAKLVVSLGGLALSSVLFAFFLAEVHARAPLETRAAELQRRFLERAHARLAVGGEAALAALREEASALGIAQHVEILDADSAGGGPLAPSEWQAVRSAGGRAGDSRDFDARHVFAWTRLDASRVAVAALAPDALAPHLHRLWLTFGVLLGAACLAAGILARLLAADVSGATAALAAQADRVASGDLRRGFVLESEDELGELARSFERMVGWLRETVGRVAEAAEGVEVTARELERVGVEVEEATVDQVGGLASARRSVEELREGVAGIASQAASLGESVEESSSTGMELRATGEELNRTAQGLSERVEEVTGALVEAAASVREVAGEAEALGRAAGETSSSMEEMASSLKEVDAAAGEMGRLSGGVVEQAEVGRERVRQTIEGMEAIREAVEVAEGVMRGLLLRAREIGAIVDVIDEVADETNLLALNAAIIAAQSGESGRAFSVVADEIKELADRVMASTKEIAGLIKAVQEESTQAQAAIEGGARSVLSGVDLSAQAGEALEAITASARSSGERVRGIAGAVREQSRAAGHVVGLMEGVREGVERIRAAGGEQERGHAVVGAAVGAMREVASSVHRTTEEQARGAARIGESVEGVREATEAIHRRLREQSEACAQAAAGLGRVAGRTQTHEDSVRRMAEATRSLRERAASLRTDVERFRT
ncbi:MAG TPA: methyl-accepting chemotaxis protein [Myxococcota bacterium]|nr:methyl-accepting chemotaxis protein [Myxococcota bacterium]